MVSEAASGIVFFFRGVSFIRKNKLSKFYVAPFFMAILFFMLNMTISNEAADLLATTIISFINKSILQEYLPSLPDVLYWIIYIIIRIVLFFVIAYLSGFFILILMSPVLSYISKKTEQILSGEDTDGVLTFFMETIRGIGVAFRSFIVETFYSLLLLVIGFIPLLGVIVPFVSFGLSGYFYAFSFADYFFERRGFNYRESKQAMNIVKWRLIGVSLPFTFTLFIPFVGSLLAAFMAIPTTAATVMALRDKQNSIQKFA